MPWFKVDDKLHDHRKARAAGATAMGVWLLAGSWAADNLTDGFIPATILSRWGRPRDATRLVEVGLWHTDEQDGEKGWRFHEWDERQPTRAQKLEERAVRAEAGRLGGQASGRSRREAKPKQSASGVLEPPSRPVPSRPTDADASVSGRKRATQLPGDFAPNDTNRRVAAEHRVDLDRVLPNFLDWHRAKGSTYIDWHAALNTWVRREKPDQSAPTSASSHLPHVSEIEEPPDGLSAQEFDDWDRARRKRQAASR